MEITINIKEYRFTSESGREINISPALAGNVRLEFINKEELRYCIEIDLDELRKALEKIAL